jgi:hypothetical protein
MNIKKIADEIEKEWFGPNGKIWCKNKQKFIDFKDCSSCSSECQLLGPQPQRLFRYMPQNDYKTTS